MTEKIKIVLRSALYTAILAVFCVGIVVFFRFCVKNNDIKTEENAVIETNVVLGEIISAKQINYKRDIDDVTAKYYLIVRIEGQLFTIDNKDLYNAFLYRNKTTQLFLVYDKLIPDKKDETKQIRIERVIYSIFK